MCVSHCLLEVVQCMLLFLTKERKKRAKKFITDDHCRKNNPCSICLQFSSNGLSSLRDVGNRGVKYPLLGE